MRREKEEAEISELRDKPYINPTSKAIAEVMKEQPL